MARDRCRLCRRRTRHRYGWVHSRTRGGQWHRRPQTDFGLTGRGGIIPLALSLDTVGPMARHVADLAAALNVMVGSDTRDPAVELRPHVDYRAALKPRAFKARGSDCFGIT